MKTSAVFFAVAAVAALAGPPARADENRSTALKSDHAVTDFSSHSRHWRPHYIRHVRYVYRPHYHRYVYGPAPYYDSYAYAPAPYYYGGGPVISFGFGGGGFRGGGWGHHRHW